MSIKILNGSRSTFYDLDTAYSNGNIVGRISWDQDNATAQVGLNTNVVLHMGQDDMWYVKNQTGASIPKGSVVYAAGTVGASGRILVAPYIANGTVAGRFILGIAAEAIADGADGYVIAKGKLRNFNTNSFTAGTVLWASPTTAGAMTSTEPSAPNIKAEIAFVVHQNTNGVLAVRRSSGTRLSDDSQVEITSPSTGQLLRYNSNRWENWSPNFLTAEADTLQTVTSRGSSTTTGATFAGNVGIGTSSPASKLQIQGTGLGAWLTITRTDSGTNIVDFTQNSTRLGYIGYIGSDLLLNNATASNTIFNTANTERMRITSAGNVGIGTTSPSAKLEVAHTINPTTSTPHITLTTSGTSKQAAITAESFAVGGLIFSTGDGTLVDRMTILRTNGNVGIGTTSPESLLHIAQSNAGGKVTLYIDNNASSTLNNEATIKFSVDSGASATVGGAEISTINVNAGNGNSDLTFKTFNASLGLSEKLRITSAGNVGIGTTAPTTKLTVVDGGIEIRDGSSTGLLYKRSSTFDFSIENAGGNLNFFNYGADERLMILVRSSNRVSIGNNQLPSAKLEVQGQGNTSATSALNITNISNTSLFRVRDDAAAIFSGLAGTGTRMVVADANGLLSTQAVGSGTVTGTGTTNYISKFTSGSAIGDSQIFDNGTNVGIGTASPSSKLDVDGGIRLSNSSRVEGRTFPFTTNIGSGADATTTFLDAGSTNGFFSRIILAGGGATNPNTIQLLTASAERMRITAGGTLLVGGTGVPFEPAWLGTAVIGKDGYNKVIIGSLDNITVGAYVGGHNSAANAWADLNVAGASVIFRTEQVERMRLASNGNVGIGTSSPNRLLTVAGTTSGLIALNASSYRNTTIGSDSVGNFIVYDDTAGVYRMTITSTGNVGIGTTSPSAKLQVVKGSQSNTVSIANSAAYIYGADVGLAIGQDNGAGGYGTWVQSARLSDNASFNMALNPNGGNVGVGTINPTRPLHLIGGDGGTGTHIAQFEGRSGVVGMYIRGDGNVGIGTTSPATRLQVVGNGEFTDTLIVSKGASDAIQQGSSLYLVGGSGASYTQLQQGVGRFIIFGFNGASWLERFTINNTSGNVGIGTTAPQKVLEVISGANNFVSVGVEGLGVGQWAGIHFGYRESNLSYRKSAIVFERTDLTANDAQGKIHILNGPQGGAGSATLSDAKLTIAENGNIGIGTTSPSAKLYVKGNAVDNIGLTVLENDYASGDIYYPTLSVINTRGNHSYGIVSEFRTNASGDADRPSILFYGAQAAHSWQVGQGSAQWTQADSFNIGYRASNTPATFPAWPTAYFTINTNGTATFSSSVTATSFIGPLTGNASTATSAGNSDTVDGLHGTQFLRNDTYNSATAGLEVFRNIGTINGSWPSSDHTFGLENSDAGNIVINFHRGGYTSNNLRYNGSSFTFDSILTADTDMRAPIFYDSANTNYYGDFGNSGTSISINGGITTTAAGGSVLLKHAVSESDAWIFQENAANWGLYWKNAPTGHHTFGGYTSIGAELVGMSAANGSGNGVATTNFVGATGAIAQWMISNFTGYIWSASTIFAAGDMRAPIFYDSNDATYYLDPNASTSLNIAGKITTAVSNGTIISNGSMTDAFGYNTSYGTYIGSTVGGTSYIYADGTFYTGGVFRTLIHSGNFNSYAPTLTGGGASGSWGISITGNAATATSAGNADTVDGYHETSFIRLAANSSSPTNGTFAIGSASSRNFIQSHSSHPLDINPLGNDVTVGSSLTVSGAVISTAVSDTAFNRIVSPSGGTFITTTSTITGAIKIQLPVLGSGMMMSCTVKVYEYSVNKSFTITFGGHRDSDNWYNEFCYLDGDSARGNLTVRFGIEGGRNCVWIGETNTSWSYPQVFVTDLQLGYVGFNSTWLSGWAVTFVSSFGTINKTQTAYLKITPQNYNSYSPTLTGGGASGNWGINITGNAATATTATNATTTVFVSSPDGDRVVGNKLPTGNPRTVRFDFASASSVGSAGNYAGVMTYAPWDGTSASTGDSSYQLAFTNQSGVNASGPAQLLLRNGINSTWNAWQTILSSSNFNSYAPTLTGGGASGTWAINISGNASSATNASNSNTVANLSPPLFFNNMGQPHTAYNDANNVGDFGVRYLNGTANSPNTGSSQYYGFTLGLGADYAFGAYASQFYWGRFGNPYVSVRFNEGGAWSAWSKIWAGYADSAGLVAWTNVSGRPTALSAFTNDTGFISNSLDSFSSVARVTSMVTLTAAEYSSLSPKLADTLYIVI